MEIDSPDSPKIIDTDKETDHETQLEEYTYSNITSEAIDQGINDNIGSSSASDSQVPEDYDSIESKDNLASNSAAFNSSSSSSASNYQVPEDNDSIERKDNLASNSVAFNSTLSSVSRHPVLEDCVSMETIVNAASNSAPFNSSSSVQPLQSDMKSSESETIGKLVEYLAKHDDPQFKKLLKVDADKLRFHYIILRGVIIIFNKSLHHHCYLVQSGFNRIYNSYQDTLRHFVNEVAKIQVRSQADCDMNDRAKINNEIRELNTYMLFYYQGLRSLLRNLAKVILRLYDCEGGFLEENLQDFLDSSL